MLEKFRRFRFHENGFTGAIGSPALPIELSLPNGSLAKEELLSLNGMNAESLLEKFGRPYLRKSSYVCLPLVSSSCIAYVQAHLHEADPTHYSAVNQDTLKLVLGDVLNLHVAFFTTPYLDQKIEIPQSGLADNQSKQKTIQECLLQFENATVGGNNALRSLDFCTQYLVAKSLWVKLNPYRSKDHSAELAQATVQATYKTLTNESKLLTEG